MKALSVVEPLAAVLLLTGTGLAFQKAPKPLPYKSIDSPEFIAAPAAGFLHEGDRLIGVTSGKTVKAYPAAILAQHGVVLDRMPDGPIAVTW
jgi:hypothetical protein